MRSRLPTMLVLLTGAPLLASSHSLQAQNSLGCALGDVGYARRRLHQRGHARWARRLALRTPTLYRFRYTVQAGGGTGAAQGVLGVEEGALMIGRAGVRDLGQDRAALDRWKSVVGGRRSGVLKVDRQEREASATTVGIAAEAQLDRRGARLTSR